MTPPTNSDSMLSSKVLKGSVVDPSLLSDGILTTIGTRAGASAFLPFGVEVTWTADVLERIHKTWEGGRVGANHTPEKDFGEILDVQFDGENAFFTLFVDEELRSHLAKNLDSVGVSIEAADPEVNERGEIIDAEGTGISFIFFPNTAACTPGDGCEILGSVPKELMKGIPDDLLLLAHGENLVDIIAEANTYDCGCDGGDECDCHSGEKLFDAAKLTTKQRKKLPGSSFCGPDRSFPSQDAAHVRNGMARLGVYKGEGKSGIARCLANKAKKVGVEVSDDFKKKYGISGANLGEPTSTTHEATIMSDDDVTSTDDQFKSLLTELKSIREDNKELVDSIKAQEKEGKEGKEGKETKTWSGLSTDEKVETLKRLEDSLKEMKEENDQLKTFKEEREKAEKSVALVELANFGIEEVSKYEKFDTEDIHMLINDLKLVAQKITANIETDSGAKVETAVLEGDTKAIVADLKKKWDSMLGWNPVPDKKRPEVR